MPTPFNQAGLFKGFLTTIDIEPFYFFDLLGPSFFGEGVGIQHIALDLRMLNPTQKCTRPPGGTFTFLVLMLGNPLKNNPPHLPLESSKNSLLASRPTGYNFFFPETKNLPLKTGAFGYDPFQKLRLAPLALMLPALPPKTRQERLFPGVISPWTKPTPVVQEMVEKSMDPNKHPKKLTVYDILLMLQKSCVHQLRLAVE